MIATIAPTEMPEMDFASTEKRILRNLGSALGVPYVEWLRQMPSYERVPYVYVPASMLEALHQEGHVAYRDGKLYVNTFDGPKEVIVDPYLAVACNARPRLLSRGSKYRSTLTAAQRADRRARNKAQRNARKRNR